MKRIKINLAIVAMLLGLTAAFAFKPATQLREDSLVWGRDVDGNWHNINDNPGAYSCESDEQDCKAYFPTGVTPSQNQTPASGDVIQAEGYITL